MFIPIWFLVLICVLFIIFQVLNKINNDLDVSIGFATSELIKNNDKIISIQSKLITTYKEERKYFTSQKFVEKIIRKTKEYENAYKIIEAKKLKRLE